MIEGVTVSLSCLPINSAKAASLTTEIISETIFDDKDRIKELLESWKSRLEDSIQNSHTYSANLSMSNISIEDKYWRHTNGLDIYYFLKNLIQNWDKNWDKSKAKLKNCYNKLFNKNGVKYIVASNSKYENKTKSELESIIEGLDKIEVKPANKNISLAQNRESVITNSRINSTAITGKLDKYHGSMTVLTQNLNFGYLWENIRVLGGAYGGQIKMNIFGEIRLFSYRDPHIENTIKTFQGIADEIEKMELTKKELDKLIIGAISSTELNKNMNDRSRVLGRMAEEEIGLTLDMLAKRRKEILSTTTDELKSHSTAIRKVIDNNNICTVGNREAINKNINLFDKNWEI